MIIIKKILKHKISTVKSMSKTTSLDNYTILELLGEGSYAKVYKAVNNDTNEVVAIKQIQYQDDQSVHMNYIWREI